MIVGAVVGNGAKTPAVYIVAGPFRFARIRVAASARLHIVQRSHYSCHVQLTSLDRTTPLPDLLQADSLALHEALADLVRAYQFRDRDRICCHDISVTQCYALEALKRDGPMRLE